MSNIKIRKGLFDTQLELEHAAVMAGFPSPADDYRHDTLDFNKDYIRHLTHSYLLRSQAPSIFATNRMQNQDNTYI